jgi:chromosome condensin MukBEF ATPase and DNA-binding subunit MukB
MRLEQAIKDSEAQLHLLQQKHEQVMNEEMVRMAEEIEDQRAQINNYNQILEAIKSSRES